MIKTGQWLTWYPKASGDKRTLLFTATCASRAGFIYGEDMRPKWALVKLTLLRGNFPSEKAKEMLPENLWGK